MTLLLSYMQEDEETLTNLYNDCKNVMFQIANSILNDPHEAENIVHDSFLRLIRNKDRFNLRNYQKAKGLIYTIVSGYAKNEYNRRKRIEISEDICPVDEQQTVSSDDHIIGQEQFESLKAAIESLDDIYSEALMLKYSHHLSLSEISKMTGMPADTVRQRLCRAKRQLRTLLVGRVK